MKKLLVLLCIVSSLLSITGCLSKGNQNITNSQNVGAIQVWVEGFDENLEHQWQVDTNTRNVDNKYLFDIALTNISNETVDVVSISLNGERSGTINGAAAVDVMPNSKLGVLDCPLKENEANYKLTISWVEQGKKNLSTLTIKVTRFE
ncbi:hypothetical protein GJ688_00030 [Heliobacillus mobilis]|uniref:Lipoprotein n=1 Tax=Heliobacterium mobile TaxID=28064 RepID=A0A6I3SD15_HELMO|nr:hypothetical protein [Heliobacterium mobile]MTV47365.1 hypothetical protein [Heliobacterium mobile]